MTKSCGLRTPTKVYAPDMLLSACGDTIRLPMPRSMQLIPFAEFATHERDALLALLARARLPARQVCVSRVAAQGEPAMPDVVLVSAPGWWRAYEGADWILRFERDLVPVTTTV